MIILASRSPRRQELLRMLGLSFQIETADVDETMDKSHSPADEVARLSAKKAEAIAKKHPTDCVIAADTIVVLDGIILGKPHDAADASRMLHLLSGRTHEVLTGLCVRQGARTEQRVVSSKVRFRKLFDAEIDAYIQNGEPMDKAGSYGIQGLGAVFVEDLQGDFFSVMGLPVGALCALLRSFGIPFLGTCETR